MLAVSCGNATWIRTNGRSKTRGLARTVVSGKPSTKSIPVTMLASSGTAPIQASMVILWRGSIDRRNSGQQRLPSLLATQFICTLTFSTQADCAGIVNVLQQLAAMSHGAYFLIRTAVRTGNHDWIKIPTTCWCRHNTLALARLAHLFRRFIRRIVQSGPIQPRIRGHRELLLYPQYCGVECISGIWKNINSAPKYYFDVLSRQEELNKYENRPF